MTSIATFNSDTGSVVYRRQQRIIIRFILLISLCNSLSVGQWAPDLQILEISTAPDNRTEHIRLINKAKNSEIVVGEDVNPNSRLLIKCNATFPVQVIYIGAGRPEFTTFTNVQWRDDPDKPLTFEAEASLGLLGFQGALRVEDTGNYTCRSIQNSTILSYYYLYVPGPALFTPPDGYNSELFYSPKDKDRIWIPCAAAHPRAIVSLHKTSNGKLQCPSFGQGLAPYDSRKGFHLNLKDKNLKNPEGVYVCIASQNNSFRMMEYKLISTNTSSGGGGSGGGGGGGGGGPKGQCNPSPCGEKAECTVVDGSPVCYCFRGLSGNPYSECSFNNERCHTNQECPPGQFCVQGKCTTNVCEPTPCGRGSICQSKSGKPQCSCKAGYDGKPPYCLKKCNYNGDCPDNEACVRNYCQNPCVGRCGVEAVCQVVPTGYNRTTVCSCAPSFTGDPHEKCYRVGGGDDTGSSCPPGHVGPGPPNCRKVECIANSDCPPYKLCLNQVCVDSGSSCSKNSCGINSECKILRSSGKTLCSCPPGTTGDPSIRCFNNTINENNNNPCQPNPCPQPNGICEVRFRGEIDCVCPSGFRGQPPNCISPNNQPQQCFEDFECPASQECIGRICVNIDTAGTESSCPGGCGLNAKCFQSACVCLENYDGDPYTICHRSSSRTSVCNPSPCANFAECREINSQAACRCILGYDGDPYSQCFPSNSRNSGYYPPTNSIPPSSRPSFEPGYVDEDIYRRSYSGVVSSTIQPPPLEGGPFRVTAHPITTTNGYEKDECDIRRFGDCGLEHICRRDFDGVAKCVCISNSCNGKPYDLPQSRPLQPTRPIGPPPSISPSQGLPPPHLDPILFPSPRPPLIDTSPSLIRPQRGPICRQKEDCRFPEICVNSTCVNPCDRLKNPCVNVAYSECRVIEGKALCTCRRGFVGNPASGLDCRRDPPGPNENVVGLSPIVSCDFKSGTGCDTKSECKLVEGRAKCVCTLAYVGTYPDCSLRCETNRDCFNAHECRNGRCVNPCDQKTNLCGRNAFCTVIDHKGICECEAGFGGNPWIGCYQKTDSNGLFIHYQSKRSESAFPISTADNSLVKCDGSRCTFF